MADMFGAPIGIEAAEASSRQNILGALQAQKTLGEIAEQPAHLALTQAHAKLYGAEAEQKDIANKSAQQMLALSTSFSQQEAQAAIAGKAERGQVATFNDIGLNRQPAVNSPTARLGNFISYLEKAGLPETQLLPLRKELADITEKTAIGDYRSSQAAEIQIKAQQEKAGRAASFAQAALNNPSQYPALLQQAMAGPNPPTVFPPVFNEAALTAIRDSGMKAKELLDLKREEASSKSTRALQDSSAKAADARVGVSKERERLIKIQADNAAKFLGDGTQATIDLKKARTSSTQATQAAKEDKQYPALPLDQKQFMLNQGYTVKGQKVVYIGKNAGGEPVFEYAAANAAKKTLAAQGTGVQGPADEED